MREPLRRTAKVGAGTPHEDIPDPAVDAVFNAYPPPLKTKLLALRKDTEKAMGGKFDQKKFHDFILAQGLLPPDLMRQAVMEGFVGAVAGGQ